MNEIFQLKATSLPRSENTEPQPDPVVPSWAEMLSDSVDQHYVASGPVIVSAEGNLEVPLAKSDEVAMAPSQPIEAISSAVLVETNGPTDSLDLFAFVRPNMRVRRSRPTYIGTFTKDFVDVTERTLRIHGVSVSRLSSPKP